MGNPTVQFLKLKDGQYLGYGHYVSNVLLIDFITWIRVDITKHCRDLTHGRCNNSFDRAIYLVEHRSFPSRARTLSEERVVVPYVIVRDPFIVTSWCGAVNEDVALTPHRPQPRR